MPKIRSNSFRKRSISSRISSARFNSFAENRILRNQIWGRIRLTDPERISLASAAKRLGRKALEVVQIVRPETILTWHRRLIAKKCDGSKNRSPGRGGSARDEIEELVLRLARENPSGDIAGLRARWIISATKSATRR